MLVFFYMICLVKLSGERAGREILWRVQRFSPPKLFWRVSRSRLSRNNLPTHSRRGNFVERTLSFPSKPLLAGFSAPPRTCPPTIKNAPLAALHTELRVVRSTIIRRFFRPIPKDLGCNRLCCLPQATDRFLPLSGTRGR